MKTETLFGKTVNVVGNVSADLVLESLGKIYIKSRNKAQTLDEIISSITSKSEESIANKTIIVDSIVDLNVKDGDFVYDKSSDILYIQIDGELNELINVNNQGQQYVKRTGDTMTGSLTIKTPSGQPPLKVTSSILNKNFNSQYLDGLPSSAYAQKAKDELISGKWTYDNTTNFNAQVFYRDNTMHYKDSLHTGSLGTPNFASGFGGYGWRLDGTTNTLTIDYIVVRKAMYVYELVVNKINATNGSLWVTNASKVEYVCQLPIVVSNNPWSSINPASEVPDKAIRAAVNGAKNDDGFIITPSLGTDTWTGEQMADNTGYGSPKTDFNYRNLQLVVCNDQSKTTDILEKFSSNNTSLNFEESDFSDSDVASAYSRYRVFNEYFDDEVVFPIAISKVKWYSDSAGNDDAYTIRYIKTYHKYFSQEAFTLTSSTFLSNLYLVKFDTDNLPVFMPGDILRCQKFTEGGIKYYDAVVCNKLKDSQFVIQVAEGIMDKTTTIVYDDNLQPTTTTTKESINQDFYNTTGHRSNDILGKIQEGDSLVQIGHLWDVTRQNAVYITSSDDGAPFIDTMSNVNRPDYSVIYNVPSFKTIKLYKKDSLPFTGNYYVQSKDSGIETVQYVLLYLTDNEGIQHSWTFEIGKVQMEVIIWYKLDGNIYSTSFDNLNTSQFTDDQRKAILNNPVRIQEVPVQGQTIQKFQTYDQLINYISSQISVNNIKYNNLLLNVNQCQVELLRGYPNEYTQLITSYEETSIDTESQGELLNEEGAAFILESTVSSDTIQPTRTTKARFGNLDGIIDSRFSPDKQPHGYGLYGENVFLTGEFVLSNGKNVAQFDKDILALFSGIEMNSVNFANLKQDIRNLLNEVPSYHNLESAGIFLMDNKLVIFGDSIQVITTRDELSGDSAPTALFADGKISAKLIEVHDIHSDYGVNGTQYYTFKGNEVYQDTEVIEGQSITYYYYLDDQQNRVRITDEQAQHLTKEYRVYGWHLKSQGDGYLAQGAINWDQNGTLNVDGNIFIKYQQYSREYNGLYISNSDGANKLIINGTSIQNLRDTSQNQTTNRITISDYTAQNATTINISNVCNSGEFQEPTITLNKVAQIDESGNVQNTFYIDYYVYNITYRTGARPPADGDTAYLVFYDNNNDPTQISSISSGSNSISICRNFSYVVLYVSSLYSKLSAVITYKTTTLISGIGSNYIKFYPSADSMLWSGPDRFNVVYRKNSESTSYITGLEIDADDIYIHHYKDIFTSGDISTIVGQSDSTQYYDNNRKSLTTLIDGGGCTEVVWSNNSNNSIVLSRFSYKHIFIGCNEENLNGEVLINTNNPPLKGTIFTFNIVSNTTINSCQLYFAQHPIINYGDPIPSTLPSNDPINLAHNILIVMYMGEYSISNGTRGLFMKIKG